MKNTVESHRPTADEIADMADNGEDISRFFTGRFTVVRPMETLDVTVNFALPMLEELDRAAMKLNVSRQALINSFCRQFLDQHYLATAAQNAVPVHPTETAPAPTT